MSLADEWLVPLAVLGAFAIAGAAIGGKEWFADWLIAKFKRTKP